MVEPLSLELFILCLVLPWLPPPPPLSVECLCSLWENFLMICVPCPPSSRWSDLQNLLLLLLIVTMFKLLILIAAIPFHQTEVGMHQTVHNYKILSGFPCAAPMIYFIEFCE